MLDFSFIIIGIFQFHINKFQKSRLSLAQQKLTISVENKTTIYFLGMCENTNLESSHTAAKSFAKKLKSKNFKIDSKTEKEVSLHRHFFAFISKSTSSPNLSFIFVPSSCMLRGLRSFGPKGISLLKSLKSFLK